MSHVTIIRQVHGKNTQMQNTVLYQMCSSFIVNPFRHKIACAEISPLPLITSRNTAARSVAAETLVREEHTAKKHKTFQMDHTPGFTLQEQRRRVYPTG